MPGLVPPARPKPLRRGEGPGIHVFVVRQHVDGRIKPGHDEWRERAGAQCPSPSSPPTCFWV
nr:hypothetical protein FJN17_20945 [Bradyrhizobium symbiodeficiens]